MNYTGVVIEESLQDKGILDRLHVVSTQVEPVTDRHETPWLKQWTLHAVEVPEEQADVLAQELSKALRSDYWYADYKNDKTHFIVFPGKVFQVDRGHVEQYQPVVKYGLSLGIPRHQLNFTDPMQEG